MGISRINKSPVGNWRLEQPMKAKTDPKTKKPDANEERFYKFAKALIAVPKKELDKEMAKRERKKRPEDKKSKHE